MLRLPEIGSHAAFKQLLSQRIHNSRLKRFDKKKLKLAVKLQAIDLSLGRVEKLDGLIYMYFRK